MGNNRPDSKQMHRNPSPADINFRQISPFVALSAFRCQGLRKRLKQQNSPSVAFINGVPQVFGLAVFWQTASSEFTVKLVETRRDYTNYPQSCQVDTFRYLAQKLGGKRLGYPIIRNSKLVFQPSPRSIRGRYSRRRPEQDLSPAFSESGCFPKGT